MNDRPGHHAPLEYHAALLGDPWRMAAWDRAIREVVRPGSRVLDVGTGTGVLAVLAARAGAQVIAVESAWIADVARETVRRNGVEDRVTVLAAPLEEVPPRPVDVVIGDWVGRLLPEKHLGDAMRVARAWAAPGARWLPAAVEVFAAPVGDATLPAIDRFSHTLLGVDLGAALPAAWATAYPVHLGRGARMAAPQSLARWLAPAFPRELAWQGRFIVERGGRLQGVAAWFESTFLPGLVLDAGPGRRTFWGQVLWPCPEVEVEPGDEVELAVRGTSEVGAVHFGWEVVVRRGREVRRRHAAYTSPLATPAMEGVPPAWGAGEGGREVGLRRWAAGASDLAAPELYAAADDDPEVAAARVEVAAARGEEVAVDWLRDFEARFGPHPRVVLRGP